MTDAQRSVAYVTFSDGRFDSRTRRMAMSALDAGYAVTVYARHEPCLARDERAEGYRVVRVPLDPLAAVPLLGPRLRGRFQGRGAARLPLPAAARIPLPLRRLARWAIFPARLVAWRRAVVDAAKPADIWHGMSIGALPTIVALKRRHGGSAVYDSRDVYMQARELARLPALPRAVLASVERRWAHACDAVVTVNDACARLLEAQLRIPRPTVVLNCPPRYRPHEPAPDLLRLKLGIPRETPVVLYQGGLLPDRGIEQSMDAMRDVPGVVLVLLGYGRLRDALRARTASPEHLGRVHVLDAVPAAQLLDWTASADVALMPIQPNSPNHLYGTPNKLFEAMAAGVPVVASDIPGMATIVRETRCGVLCDPTSPRSIAHGIRSILELPPAERSALRARCLASAHAKYNWESQEATLLHLYRTLVERGAGASR